MIVAKYLTANVKLNAAARHEVFSLDQVVAGEN
jgi:hypothetical protein